MTPQWIKAVVFFYEYRKTLPNEQIELWDIYVESLDTWEKLIRTHLYFTDNLELDDEE
jgi:hypothetical protein